MNLVVFTRSRRACGFAALLFPLLLACIPVSGTAAEPFRGYPEEIRRQSLRLIDTAEPGRAEELELEVQALRKAMLEYAIVSVNVIPDLVFERARKEGWESNAGQVLRPITRVAPLSVPLWAWLVREDAASFDIAHLIKDVEGIEGALRRYGPGIPGIAAWSFLFLIASASWFAIWASVSLLLRAQPALTCDFARFLKKFPRPEIFAFAVFLVCLLAPVLTGIGAGMAAMLWFILSAGYLRRWELATAIVSILFLGAVVVFGGALQSFTKYTEETRRGGWLGGEGYFPTEWPESASGSGHPFGGSRWEEMVRFARARAEMQAGNHAEAESLWTEWIRNAEDPSAGHNNRGIVRFRLGKPSEALADFEAAVSRKPPARAAYWNSYQLYLQTFRLEEAARIQESAWRSLRHLSLFDYRAEEMTHGELLPSPLQLAEGWMDLFTPRREWLRDSMESPVQRFLFRPLRGNWIPVFLAAGLSWMLLWKPLSMKIWMHGTCRSCGISTLMVGGPGSADICNQCRAQVGGGIRLGEEREHRVLGITMHRRYVRACSVLIPGAGAFWAGKGVSVMVYGLLLSMFLGVVTVSLGARASVPLLIASMLDGVETAALAVVLLFWVFGIVWSWRSFESLQGMYNIVPRR